MKQEPATITATRRSRAHRSVGAAGGPKGFSLAPPKSGIGFVDCGPGTDGPLCMDPPSVVQARPTTAVAREGDAAAGVGGENRTGLPDDLKSGIEALSGLSMEHVRVHYNSDKPATLQASAYTQGADIHVGPGQHRHLAHEAWHVVQQRQGRVRPTLRWGGVAVNDDVGLEREADTMGAKAASVQLAGSTSGARRGASRGLTAPSGSTSPSSVREVAQLWQVLKTDPSGEPERISNAEGRGRIHAITLPNVRDDQRDELLEAIQEVWDGLTRAEVDGDRVVIEAVNGAIWIISDIDGWGIEILHRVYDDLTSEPSTGRSFSGIGRASADEGQRRDYGARYKTPLYRYARPSEFGGHRARATSGGELDISVNANRVTSTIVHREPWKKGSRNPSQSAVMFGRSAKDYTSDIRQLNGRHPGGRWEWLHLIGSSLGGDNVLGNLVAGGYDANTEMIPYERRFATWANVMPLDGSSTLTLTTTADLEGDSWVAERIQMDGALRGGRDGDRRLDMPAIEDAQSRRVLTEAKYRQLQADADWRGKVVVDQPPEGEAEQYLEITPARYDRMLALGLVLLLFVFGIYVAVGRFFRQDTTPGLDLDEL